MRQRCGVLNRTSGTGGRYGSTVLTTRSFRHLPQGGEAASLEETALPFTTNSGMVPGAHRQKPVDTIYQSEIPQGLTMLNIGRVIAASGFLVVVGALNTAQAQCLVPPTSFNGMAAEVEGTMTVTSGKGCRFGLNGIPGAIKEAAIIQQPKIGRAGVQGLNPYYIAKPGYTGPDEFAYMFTGTDQYGGPMRVVIKRKVTVVP
jgi:hypothetical protein